MIENTIVGIIAMLIGVGIGISTQDYRTLRECSTKGESAMSDGVVIECTVRKAK